MKTVRIMMLGDAVGTPGCAMFQKHVSHLKEKYAIDAIIVNGENSAPNGKGITSRVMQFFKHNGANVVTSGNHIWQQKDILSYFDTHTDLVRPENFPTECPGSGVTTFAISGVTIGVLNLQGRVFMRELLSCPFKAADSALTYLRSRTNIIVVDMHAETSSEKTAMAYHLDGRVSAVVGTHTHVQTADEQILPKGTAYITDLGMAGALHSMIGMKKEPIIQQLITQMPTKFTVETEGPFVMSGVWIEIDVDSGKAKRIERIRIIDNELVVKPHEKE
ncbi:MAG: TIGR00282 family metallophosphoesterase [Candidatus Babeliales bacterium]